jgi:hypothetical protein
MKWMGNAASLEENINAYEVSVRKPLREGSIRRSIFRRKDNIKMDHTDIGWECVKCVHLARVQW